MNSSDSNSEQRRRKRTIVRYEKGRSTGVDDFLATEEPLEIRVVFGPANKRKDRSLSITMRTPGNDSELAAGFLLGEGIVKNRNEISHFEETGPVADGSEHSNQLCVHLHESVRFDFGSLQRNFYTTSSCGICGKASLDAVRAQLIDVDSAKPSDSFEVSASTIESLPNSLRSHQETFEQTGGLHAAGLFGPKGDAIAVFEDVGRHNALDKLIGNQFLNRNTPLENHIVVVSGRASFELVQKLVSAQVPVMVAVGAPSSLAAELAEEFGITLIGFASSTRFNVYTHADRISDKAED